MTTAVSTSKAVYLERVAAGLADLREDDREEVLQDLRAHLEELDETELEAALGSPDDFVAEFRASAGLGDDIPRKRRWSLTRTRARLEEASRKLAELTRWQAWRPLWIWTRGWVLLSTVAVLSGGTAFDRFPIPTVGGSTIVGLGSLFLTTSVSLWLDQRETPIRQVGSFMFNSVAVALLLGSLLSERYLAQTDPFEEDLYYTGQLSGPEGETISNIYAYDLDGEPVQVLLFDQEGRPIRTLPTSVYAEAEHPGFSGPIEYGEGAVEFSRDEFGRVIPNLYPLTLYRYSGYGLEPMPPPSLGFPRADETDSDRGGSTVPTTTMPGALD